MVHIHMELEPHIGAPIVARAEAEAQRLARKAKAEGAKEPLSVISPMPTRHCCRAPARGEPNGPSWWCW
jgi:hypothetical protein